ncbi:MAG: Sua5/YciO/YrdC/YwlC family protein, partial [Nanoarchaeota archaeon]|nr:Sua5/YciO/YrdC/YwlC family protein [Nanoarchaeota archaeon]
AKEYADISPEQERFLEAVWPGKVTVVLRTTARTHAEIDADSRGKPSRFVVREGTIGMRVPDDEFLQKILREMGIPLAQTSANVSGMPPARSAEEVRVCFKAIKRSPNILLDGGVRAGDASSVIDLSGLVPLVLREGAFPKARLFELLRDSGFSGFSGL